MQFKIRYWLLVIGYWLFLFFPFGKSQGGAYAQQYRLPLNKDIHQQYEQQIIKEKTKFHTSVKPFLSSELNAVADTFYSDIKSPFSSKVPHWLWRKTFNEHFLKVDTGNFYLTIDPLVNLQAGKELQDGNFFWTNTRGFWVRGGVGSKFSFASRFYENQSQFPGYLHQYIARRRIVPGQGLVKKFKGESDKLDYAYASGYVSYSPSRNFNFQFGHGKNFFGDGYRSLLLSDAAFNYPFFKITTSAWKIKYVNLFTQFTDIRSKVSYSTGYPRKYGAFHYFDINIGNRLFLGLFEGIIWQAQDSLGYRGIDINYLNPIIFYHPVQSALGHGDNAVLGLNLKYQLNNHLVAYGQLVLDDFNLNKTKEGHDTTKSTFYNLTHVKEGGLGFFQNKWGYQLGLKYFNVAGIEGLYFQTEYNRVRPYVYAHKTPLQNYGHYNQSLAHPLGANFWESVSFLKYNNNRFFAELEILFAQYGADTSGSHWGKDIYPSDYSSERGLFSFGNYIGQGVLTNLFYSEFKTGLVVNPKTNLRLEFSVVNRQLSSAIENENTFLFSVGIRSALRNLYYDF